MLPIHLIYDFQLLQRGIPVYINGQLVELIIQLKYDKYYLLKTPQELVFAHGDKKLSLTVIKAKVYNDMRLS